MKEVKQAPKDQNRAEEEQDFLRFAALARNLGGDTAVERTETLHNSLTLKERIEF